MSIDFAAIDFEIANPKFAHSACSVGLVIVRNGVILDRFYSLLNPQVPFNAYSVAVHHITEQDVVTAPTFPSVWEHELAPRIGSLPLVAHNKSCELRVLSGCAEHYNMDIQVGSTLCTMRVAKQLIHTNKYSLSALCATFGYQFDAHNALDDAEACAALCLHLADIKRADSICDIIGLDENQASIDEINTQGCDDPEQSKIVFNLDHDSLFGQSFVFTGDLSSLSRDNATLYVNKAGAYVGSSVSKTTTVLVVGTYAENQLADSGDLLSPPMSTKHKTALNSISKGQNIEILHEDEFLCLLDGSYQLSVSPVLPHLMLDLYYGLLDFDMELSDCFPEMRIVKDGISINFYNQKSASIMFSPSKGCTVEIDDTYHDILDKFALPYSSKCQYKKVKNQQNEVIGKEKVVTHIISVGDLDIGCKLYPILALIAKDKYNTVNADPFACCNDFLRCSDAKHCLHSNDWDYVGCGYNRNLKAGRIFYGKNKTTI